ncbi:hypothetical protein DIU31_008635 [Mucilaginibacter rubeus]|uniref:Transporter n=1 Tax=Mucilaginibacter rubeus TaxID=2027860 RepID=A0AAE6JDB2_9SPHI|nr:MULTISPECIES: hypothetical protein [Mucilaginibacter]QEM03579.1 hypothetical protein DIU31_008635 [Mucilaginibacter rubeus]QTE38872.1 hypothetical protein J3L18_07345 [Mucilaginibacter gossypii]QTE41052.1 hypothetical protein J3L19_19035 [Mucilaginibacter rubeus]QTE47655.1 hypothetical protein J3L21_19015 [Mucilaginibacter rubeus]QTE59047.1 hypothetical protein J3L23_10680 [Mucilaginibacter rubeus]
MKYLCLLILVFYALELKAQDNYEIQVYGSETVEKGKTMFELHSNYTLNGSKTVTSGELPTNHVVHETVEITHGWTTWFETGFYIFNSIGDAGRTAYVGSHIRPRVAAPSSWNWPVGVSISTEFGFQKAAFSANTSTLEIRPIVDKKWNKLYVSLNPTLEKSFKGPDQNRGFTFSPNVKGSYDVTKVVALGLEYYGSTGPFFHYDPIKQQDHQLFVATDLNADPKWEFNGGIGYGFTSNSDRAIVKIIIGRRF